MSRPIPALLTPAASSPRRRSPGSGFIPKESAVLAAILEALLYERSVAWARRMNTGATKIEGRFIRFGFPGCPDILGQSKDGRLIAIEVKRPKGRQRPAQIAFVEHARDHGARAGFAQDVMGALWIVRQEFPR
jgi:hypothetical protein